MQIIKTFLYIFICIVMIGCSQTPQSTPSLESLEKIALDYVQTHHPSWPILPLQERGMFVIDRGKHWEWSYSSRESMRDEEEGFLSLGGGQPVIHIDKKTLKVIHAYRDQ
jgi:hypothetical protein